MDSITYIFGGTFDPVHQGHIGVIRELLAGEGQILLAPTSSNPLKNTCPTPLDARLRMLELVLQYEAIPYSSDLAQGRVVLSSQDYVYAKTLIHWLRSQGRSRLSWVVGPDLAAEVKHWRDWDSLDTGLYVAQVHADDLHSSNVRHGSTAPHPAIRDFIREENLYPRSHP